MLYSCTHIATVGVNC